jgi:hypothetical protein
MVSGTAALAAAVAGGAPHELGHHELQVSAFCDAVTMAAMRAGDAIGWLQGSARTHCHGFFANVQVGQTRHQATLVDITHSHLELTDLEHLA